MKQRRRPIMRELKRSWRVLVITSHLPLLTPSIHAALTGASAQVTDAAGAVRTGYSSSEKVTLNVRVQNTAASASPIQFSFEVLDPGGSRRLFQTGNTAPGSVLGASGASLRGIAVSRFYTVPGNYTLVGKAVLGGETAEARAVFTVLSPAVTLTYPPNGARDLIDQPLTFRWVSSGAVRYRIFVDDDSSFYNVLFSGDAAGSVFSYPQNPPDVRQRLASGQTYYWKVEGLDASNNVIARSDIPFSFTMKSLSPQATSKDLAVVSLEKVNEPVPGAPGALPVAVLVKNQGGKAESNVSVNVFADGAAVPSSPKRLTHIEPGRTERLVFPVRPPERGRQLVVSAVLDFFDDNLQNNALTRQFTVEAGGPGETRMRPAQAWEGMKRFVSDPRMVAELEGYTLVGVQGADAEEFSRLVRAIQEGKARITSVRFTEE
jgi:hypothetical protein